MKGKFSTLSGYRQYKLGPPGNSISHMFQNSKDIKEHLTPLQSTPSYSVPLSKSKLKKHLLPGILWQSSGQEDSMLPMQGA